MGSLKQGLVLGGLEGSACGAQQIKIVQNNSLSIPYPKKAFAKAEVGRTRRKQILKPQMLPLCKGLIAAQVRMQSHP